MRDITGRKQAEDMRRLKNFVFDVSIGSKSIADVNGIITEANSCFLRVWGYPDNNEVIGKLISFFIEDPDAANTNVNTLTNMSHEIRTPMNGVIGFLDLLNEPELTNDYRKEYTALVQQSGKRMLNILHEIVDISRIDAGETIIHFQKTNINEKIERVYKLLKPDAENKKINLSFKNSLPVQEANVITDSLKLYSILTNLVKTAIKYTDTGSVEFGYDKKVETLEFFVKDTGIGINKERHEAIFERFFQADIADVQARQGAGLGLSIAKAYVEMPGGKIWVNSEVGIGSAFYFTIPSNSETEEIKVVQKDLNFDKKGNHVTNLKILIAEDDEVSTMLLDKTVEMFGREVIKVRTGVEAFEACHNNPDLDLVLMDIKIPEMDGYEATRQIRQFNKDVVIIAQTAYGLFGDVEMSIEAGCNDYISKPFNKAGLLSLIQKHIKK